jgi:hypothetical protein
MTGASGGAAGTGATGAGSGAAASTGSGVTTFAKAGAGAAALAAGGVSVGAAGDVGTARIADMAVSATGAGVVMIVGFLGRPGLRFGSNPPVSFGRRILHSNYAAMHNSRLAAHSQGSCAVQHRLEIAVYRCRT